MLLFIAGGALLVAYGIGMLSGWWVRGATVHRLTRENEALRAQCERPQG